jgi:molecular chaperone GrpE
MDKDTKNGAVRIEVIDKRVRDEDQVSSAVDEAGAATAQDVSAATQGSFTESTPQEGSAQRLRERDDAERWLSGSAHSSSALGSESDPSPDLAIQLEEFKKLAQLKEAELRNYRQRVRQDMDDARRFAVESLLHDLFPAMDALAQALAGFGTVQRGDDPLLDGVRNTAKALEKALTKHGIERIDATGVPFDSEQHQPVQVEASHEVTEDTVGEVYASGFRLGGKVLKPAMVKVLQPE